MPNRPLTFASWQVGAPDDRPGYSCVTPKGHIEFRGRYVDPAGEDYGPAAKFVKLPFVRGDAGEDDMVDDLTKPMAEPARGRQADEAIFNYALTIPRQLWTAAASWWELVGRHQVRKEANIEEVGRKVRRGFVIQGDKQPTLLSGIMRGLPWDELQGVDQAKIIIRYAQNHPSAAWWREQQQARTVQ